MARPVREAQILDAAAAEFGTRGFATASVDEIAARVGVSKPLVYSYFGSKEGLYVACVERAGERLVAAVTAAQHGPPAQRALATLDALFVTLDGRRHDWALLYDATLRDGSAGDDAARGYRRRLNATGADGTRALVGAEGDPLDQDLLTELWFGTITTVLGWWGRHPDESAEDMSARCARVLAVLSSAAR